MNQELSNRYKTLLSYLTNGRWQEADEETYEVMCQVIGKKGWDWEVKDIQNFPCEDLRILDRLWVKFSGGRFGFSVQRDIYASKEVGGKLDGRYDDEAFDRFCTRVKWREGGRWMFDNLTYDLTSVRGHLPVCFLCGHFGCLFFCSLLARTDLQPVTSDLPNSL